MAMSSSFGTRWPEWGGYRKLPSLLSCLFRGSLCFGMALCLMQSSQVSAFPMELMRPVDGLRFETPISLRLSEQPLWIREFSTHLLPGVAASRLGRISALPLNQALSGPDGSLLLSGLRGRWHWLVEIRHAATGSRGRVSALCIRHCQSPEEPARPEKPGTLPSSEQGLQFQLSDNDSSGRMALRIEALSGDTATTLAKWKDRLWRHGWRPEGTKSKLSEHMEANWQQGMQRLNLQLVELGGGGRFLLLRHE